MGRVVLVLFLLSWVGVAWALHRRRQIEAERVRAGERLPAGLRDSSARRTWVLVTSPMCASCGPVEKRLRELAPQSRIITFDATESPRLARLLRVRAAPTLLLADRNGNILHRLAGPDSVNAHLDRTLTTTAGPQS